MKSKDWRKINEWERIIRALLIRIQSGVDYTADPKLIERVKRKLLDLPKAEVINFIQRYDCPENILFMKSGMTKATLLQNACGVAHWLLEDQAEEFLGEKFSLDTARYNHNTSCLDNHAEEECFGVKAVIKLENAMNVCCASGQYHICSIA